MDARRPREEDMGLSKLAVRRYTRVCAWIDGGAEITYTDGALSLFLLEGENTLREVHACLLRGVG